jgi:hypothetical protein
MSIYAILQSLLLFGTAVGNELTTNIAIIKLIGKAGENVGAANVNAGIEHVGADVNLAMRGEEGRR